MGIFLDFLIIPFLASYFILILNWKNYNLHIFSLLISILLFYYSIYILIIFNKSIFLYQFIESYYSNWQFFNNFEYLVGIDNISLFFLLLTSFIFPISILYLRQFLKYKYFKNFILYLYFLIFFLFQVFSVLDIFLFYFFFESILIPMFYIIIIFGSRYRKIRSVYLLILYTFIGSIFMLIGLILIYLEVGSFNMILLSNFRWDNIVQYYLWFFFFISFSIKIPMFPFYIWLPEAHVEAPTIGSVILAALLLKLGGYGFIRILIPIFYKATLFFLPFVFMLALISILYASLTIIRQVDIKKIVAYSSIIHMNIIVLGIFSLNTISLIGSIFFMIAHGIISSALFFLAGILYDRYKTRLIFYYGGLFNIMPIFSFFFFFFSFLNISFPGTIGFIGELLVLTGFLNINFFYTFLVILCLILSVIYSIWLLNRIIFGNFKKINNIYFYDLNFREFLLLIPLLIISIILGIKPSLCLDYLILI